MKRIEKKRWRRRLKGDIGEAALIGLSVATALTYTAVVGAGIAREQIRIGALVAETNRIIEAVQNYQAENVKPLSEYKNTEDIGWPDPKGPDNSFTTDFTTVERGDRDDCSRALNILAGDTSFNGSPDPEEPAFLPEGHAQSSRSLADPRLRWLTSCSAPRIDPSDPTRAINDGGQVFRLFLTSFGEDPACYDNPNSLVMECPDADLAYMLAAATGGQVKQEGAGTPGTPIGTLDSPSPYARNNVYIEWPIFRGAAWPTINNVLDKAILKEYTDSTENLQIEKPTSAFSGIRLGGLNAVRQPDGSTVEQRAWAENPGRLARWISGIDSSDTTINPKDVAAAEPLAVAKATQLDARSFAIFNRVTRYDPFNLSVTSPDILYDFNTAAQLPCADMLDSSGTLSSGYPTFTNQIEVLQLTFWGFDSNSLQTDTITLPTSNPGPANHVTLSPIGWQIFDDESPPPPSPPSTKFSPEVRVNFFVILPAFDDGFTTKFSIRSTPSGDISISDPSGSLTAPQGWTPPPSPASQDWVDYRGKCDPVVVEGYVVSNETGNVHVFSKRPIDDTIPSRANRTLVYFETTIDRDCYSSHGGVTNAQRRRYFISQKLPAIPVVQIATYEAPNASAAPAVQLSSMAHCSFQDHDKTY